MSRCDNEWGFNRGCDGQADPTAMSNRMACAIVSMAQLPPMRGHADEVVDHFGGAGAVIWGGHAATLRNALLAVFRISRCANPDRAAASISSAIASSRPII